MTIQRKIFKRNLSVLRMIFMNELKLIIRLNVCLSGELNFDVLMEIVIRILYICIQRYYDKSKQHMISFYQCFV